MAYKQTDTANVKQIRQLALKIALQLSEIEAKLDAQTQMNKSQLELLNSIINNLEVNGNS